MELLKRKYRLTWPPRKRWDLRTHPDISTDWRYVGSDLSSVVDEGGSLSEGVCLKRRMLRFERGVIIFGWPGWDGRVDGVDRRDGDVGSGGVA